MPKSLDNVRRQLSSGEFDLTLHVARRLIQRQITELDIMEVGATARIIEEYSDEKYSPSCLLLGFTGADRPLHILVSLADTDLFRVITVYEPDPEYWTDNTTRR